MNKITVKNHILASYIHGGYDDAASVTLWIDEAAGIAHLTAHSGSMIPVDGPVAPSGAPRFEAVGRSGYVADFDQEHVSEQVELLNDALKLWELGAENEEIRSELEDILVQFDLAEMTYSDYLAENDPDTHAELYA